MAVGPRPRGRGRGFEQPRARALVSAAGPRQQRHRPRLQRDGGRAVRGARGAEEEPVAILREPAAGARRLCFHHPGHSLLLPAPWGRHSPEERGGQRGGQGVALQQVCAGLPALLGACERGHPGLVLAVCLRNECRFWDLAGLPLCNGEDEARARMQPGGVQQLRGEQPEGRCFQELGGTCRQRYWSLCPATAVPDLLQGTEGPRESMAPPHDSALPYVCSHVCLFLCHLLEQDSHELVGHARCGQLLALAKDLCRGAVAHKHLLRCPRVLCRHQVAVELETLHDQLRSRQVHGKAFLLPPELQLEQGRWRRQPRRATVQRCASNDRPGHWLCLLDAGAGTRPDHLIAAGLGDHTVLDDVCSGLLHAWLCHFHVVCLELPEA
mmetsp:Transcript_52971/g.154163  ORF Transcript_52971/g.154163 Transcript_52971/m.154163 type:complete len:382 (-) Transcript_52971:1323-2468(-)